MSRLIQIVLSLFILFILGGCNNSSSLLKQQTSVAQNSAKSDDCLGNDAHNAIFSINDRIDVQGCPIN